MGSALEMVFFNSYCFTGGEMRLTQGEVIFQDYTVLLVKELDVQS